MNNETDFHLRSVRLANLRRPNKSLAIRISLSARPRHRIGACLPRPRCLTIRQACTRLRKARLRPLYMLLCPHSISLHPLAELPTRILDHNLLVCLLPLR